MTLSHRQRVSAVAVATAAALSLSVAPIAFGQDGDPLPSSLTPSDATVEHHPAFPDIVTLRVKDRAAVDRLSDLGFDLGEEVAQVVGGMEVQALATAEQQGQLRRLGVEVGAPVKTKADSDALQAEYRAMTAAVEAAELQAATVGDELRVQRAQWFADPVQGRFLEVEVWSSAGAAATTRVTVTFDTGQSFELSPFIDAGKYQFHRVDPPVKIGTPAVPTTMTVTSTAGGTVTVPVTQTLTGSFPKGPGAPIAQSAAYESSFVDKYLDATESTARIEALAAEFPGLAEIVEMPHKTDGYGRPAMLTLGAQTSNAVVLTSKADGHEGGNAVTVAFVNPGAANSPLAVTASGSDITVSLATGTTGALTSTAAQVAAALNATPASSALVTATTYRLNAGAGVVAATARGKMSDFLLAPERVSREPATVKAIRIGRHRDGSRVGVLGYAQEHAREWVTPLTAIESAERLLRNYDNDDNTKRLVDDLDIFIIPTINPDGTNYSIHDNTFQRRNLTNYCGAANNDSAWRNSWGVDLNRNFTVGSRLDGFAGASGSCTSDTYSGPSELSEPEAKNEVWLTDEFDNIKFSMNIHSHGGYFMWAPGAYKQATRDGLDRPSYGTERYFYEASSHILNRIKEHRGTNIWDARVGPISDVLYSAAGNSGDELFYNRGIFAWSFEVGAPRRNATDTAWNSVGFTPPFAEGYEESQEFSNGLIGMFEVARMYARDVVKPKSELTPGAGTHAAGTTFTFSVSEPADVYYTTDGTRPTTTSAKLSYQGPRQGVASFTLPKGSTEVRWFAKDVRGNVEGGYDPASRAANYRSAKVTVK